jgi:TatD DNase family protein
MDFVLADIGLNLAHDSFDRDRDRVMADAWDAGVRFAVITGSTLASSRAAIELVRARPQFLRATAGVHPHHAREFHDADVPALVALVALPEVGAVGECGLDYFRNFSPHADQERVFHSQLELAGGSRKPVFLHQRDAHAAFVGVLREYRPRLAGGVAHCFTGDDAELDDYLGLGLYIGITGWICDERRGLHLRELVRRLEPEAAQSAQRTALSATCTGRGGRRARGVSGRGCECHHPQRARILWFPARCQRGFALSKCLGLSRNPLLLHLL